MFVPKDMLMESLADAHDFIDEFDFGVVISSDLTGTHLPFLLKRSEGEFGSLYCHMARANTHWHDLDGQEVVVIFTGNHSYISPTWYHSSPAVPTWNYSAVHAKGYVSILSPEHTLESVESSVLKYEPNLIKERNIVTVEYTEKLLRGIVGLKITLSSIEGKHKLGQYKSLSDQAGVFAGLKASKSPDAQALAAYMVKLNLGTGN